MNRLFLPALLIVLVSCNQSNSDEPNTAFLMVDDVRYIGAEC